MKTTESQCFKSDLTLLNLYLAAGQEINLLNHGPNTQILLLTCTRNRKMLICTNAEL